MVTAWWLLEEWQEETEFSLHKTGQFNNKALIANQKHLLSCAPAVEHLWSLASRSAMEHDQALAFENVTCCKADEAYTLPTKYMGDHYTVHTLRAQKILLHGK